MTSRADQHDLDKLDRWCQSLQDSAGDFPVYAIFLVSESDQSAHDTFRAFRRSFEARNAGFENLVIFGQHGVSGTVHALLAELGLDTASLPLLMLLGPSSPQTYYLLLVPQAEQHNSQPEAAEILFRLERVVDGGEGRLSLDNISGLVKFRRREEDLRSWTKRLLGTLS